MQAGEEVARGAAQGLSPCPPHVVELVRKALRCYGGASGVELLCVLSDCIEVLAVARRAAVLALELRDAVFTAGVHVARLCSGRLLMLLGALQLVRGRVVSHYIVVTEHGEKLFLYGRDVLPESVVEERLDEACLRSGVPVAVLNQHGDPLGYALPRRRGRIIIYENLLDAGWYLRSGV